ncbi:hypothetical protein J416_12177 [Gracilibacillus halophilus YIM-C55.5]|uniref:Peptidase S9 prolyl oligopeptidase catalytic domain-containing protein n=1 Tax=Gracilibacillus halophilus YIM-C55.5 TaxID=1308866 RepID=N4WJ45_9BACI|nr:alpha/beta fold hydrolase [Gracilibacillus halophilus]ENH96167.1 hypothetical protein J416_12177 [Gracilibacillus halophilus YIM-C55.5]
MITIEKEYWNGVPLLHIAEDDKRQEPMPTLVYMHGFTSAKEHNLPLAYLLSERGYRVILPDSLLHGEREKDISDDERQLQFFDIVKQNLDDIEMIYQELVAHQLLDHDRLGLAGTSMGGITTASALTQFSWVKVAAVMMGSPKIHAYAKQLIDHIQNQSTGIELPEAQINALLEDLKEIDLSLQMEKLFDRPLFFWHGQNDRVVPFDHSYRFYEEAIEYYKNPENIRFLKEMDAGHKVSRFAIIELVNWLELQL